MWVTARSSVPPNPADPTVPGGKREGLEGWAGGLESLTFPPWSEVPTKQAGDPPGMWLSDEREGQQGAWAPTPRPPTPASKQTQPSPTRAGCPHQAKFICPNDLTRCLRVESWRVFSPRPSHCLSLALTP